MSEYLYSKSYVSRLHAKLILENNELFIENFSNTNFTNVNNEKITGRVRLEDSNEIGLGALTQMEEANRRLLVSW